MKTAIARMAARRALGIRGMVSYAIITQLRRTAIAITIASVVMLLASLANRLAPTGLRPAEVGGAIHWNGWIVGVPDGTYTFGVPSGGVTQLAIDGRVVADGTTSAPIHLDQSAHAFDFEDRRGSGQRFDVSFSHDGSEPSALPASVLFSRKPRTLTLTVVDRKSVV